MSTKDLNSLDKLSTEEIGKLFPIVIEQQNEKWASLFQEEKRRIFDIIGDYAIRIEHIGSTAIPSISAKPIIDILVEIPNDSEIKDEIIAMMKAQGYHFILRKDRLPPFLSFLKGYTTEGYKGQVYHIYMAEKEHEILWDRIYFRDYLRENETEAKEYESIKLKLAKLYEFDREAYTKGKDGFVTRITEIAKQLYK